MTSPGAASIALLGTSLDLGGPFEPPAALFDDRDVFVTELASLFFAAPTLVGHASQVPRPGDRIVVDVATRSYLVVRGNDGGLVAYRNRCLHAGYPICAPEAPGSGPLLVCQFHAWAYALTGTLVDAPSLLDGTRPRPALPPIPVFDRAGLLSIDPSTRTDGAGARGRIVFQPPRWIADAAIVNRDVIDFDCNWKHLQWRLDGILSRRLPGTSFDGTSAAFGWLSHLVIDEASRTATIVTLVPRSIRKTSVLCTVLQADPPRTRESSAVREPLGSFSRSLCRRLGEEPWRMPTASADAAADSEAAAALAFLSGYRVAMPGSAPQSTDPAVCSS